MEITYNDRGYLEIFGFPIHVMDLEEGRFAFPAMTDVLFDSEPIQFYFSESGEVVEVLFAQVKVLEKISN